MMNGDSMKNRCKKNNNYHYFAILFFSIIVFGCATGPVYTPIVGSIGKVGSRYILNSKLIDLLTGETVSTAHSVYLSIDELIDGCDSIARELTDY